MDYVDIENHNLEVNEARLARKPVPSSGSGPVRQKT